VNTRLASKITGFRPNLSEKDITEYPINYLMRLLRGLGGFEKFSVFGLKKCPSSSKPYYGDGRYCLSTF
jgi:hypothetical protein